MKPKISLTETEVRNLHIRPAIVSAGWEPITQMREEEITKGQIVVKGNASSRNKSKILKPDFTLYYKLGIPLAAVEAKSNEFSIEHGISQAIDYARYLDVPFAFSSNGDGFCFHDKTAIPPNKLETTIALHEFPSPEELWLKYTKWKKWTKDQERQCAEDYHSDDEGDRIPRYYQSIAINSTIEAIAKGQDKILLVMATGTGKTYTAFQIITRYRNYQIKHNNYQPRILFLADRNILVDQTMVNDFRPFKGVMAKLSSKSKVVERSDGKEETLTSAIKKGRIETSYEIYLGLYQSITGNDETKKVFKTLPTDFFDLIVIDECHRGSAKNESAWREILTYFNSATQVGLTATPKETKEVSNSDYFGDALYTYTLAQGIEDGFLAPYKVIKIGFDIDKEWKPDPGMKDRKDKLVEDRIYNVKDYDRNLVIDNRTKAVAKILSDHLKQTNNRMSKTIVFCSDVDHAIRMRQALINENQDLVLENDKYIERITGDNKVGKDQLDYFIDPDEQYPVLVTTSELMTTGVDAKTCKYIVIDQVIESMTKFKQVIGRGTRIHEDGDHNKTWFTIFDFKNASKLIYEDDFNGPSICIYEPKEGDSTVPPDEREGDQTDGTGQTTGTGNDESQKPDEPDKEKREKVFVDGVSVNRVDYTVSNLGLTGQLESESYQQIVIEAKKTFTSQFSSLNDFIRKWNDADKKQAIIEEFSNQGIVWETLYEAVDKKLDPYDLISYLAFNQPPLTRQERANNVQKRNCFGKYSEPAKQVLQALLDKYADNGIEAIEDNEILKVQPISDFGNRREIYREVFSGKADYQKALRELEDQIYSDAYQQQA
ncbi:DEAD/DEAH box helicase family protein [Vibrio scophthalmi]|uniref:EcoAI/FtnUII family type I restriction enzme subunit R n=1 Tax=Vibrio scophthalmi TaxID=45658 RepID=UPI003AB1017E